MTDEADTLKLAIISDLHVGEKARSLDLCIAGTSPDMLPNEKFRERFLEFVSSNSLRADYLVIPGDITNKAQPEEFDVALEVIGEIASELGIGTERLIFVPGNHDVDWTVLNGVGPIHRTRLKQRYDPFRDSFGEKLRDATSLTNPPYYEIFREGKVLFLLYNSANHDGPSTGLNHGKIDLDHLAEIRKSLDKIERIEGEVRIFVTHHHLSQYPELVAKWLDVSLMQNATELHKVLDEFDFDFAIHGHKHFPHFNILSMNTGKHIPYLGAGTFCRQIETELAGHISNQFHMVTIEGRDSKSNNCVGQLQSWAYFPVSGWNKSYVTGGADFQSRRGTGIEHIRKFGGYANPSSIATIIHEVILNNFATTKVIAFKDIRSHMPQFDYVSKEVISKALDIFSQSSQYDIMRENSSECYIVGDKNDD